MAASIHQPGSYLQYVQSKYAHLLVDENYILDKMRHISKYNKDDLVFGKIVSEHDREQLGLFRLKNYQQKKPYMLNELDQYGLDEYDAKSTIYAAWLNHEMIASIRLGRSPFESNCFLPDETLKNFLGANYKNEYLEWTRLLIQPEHRIPGLLPALIIYAGIKTLAQQDYHHYFGYSTLIVKRLFSRFQLSQQSLEFTIPKRGKQTYILLKGDFAFDFLNVLNT